MERVAPDGAPLPKQKPTGAAPPVSGVVRVRHVLRNSPADRAGLRDGDILLRIGSTKIAQPDQVVAEVSTHAPGETLHLAVRRGKSETTANVTLSPMPDTDQMLRLDKVGAFAPSWQSIAVVAGVVPPTIGEMRGRVVVVDFWATWCMACRMLTPKLSAWQAKYGAQGLSVIGITDDPVASAVEGITSFGIKYPVATDESSATQRAFGVHALPTMFIIDKRGVVREVAVGFDPQRDAELEALVMKLLSEPADVTAAPAHH
jgi:thiol-disulfide isomerase/thioredoxin